MVTNKQFKASLLILLAVYVLLLSARAVYNLRVDPVETAQNAPLAINVRGDFIGKTVSNIASDRKEFAVPAGVEVLDQKYERIASITAKSARYDDDIAQLDEAVEEAQAVVQEESERGLQGSRSMYRVIGVKPQFFDQCQDAISKIGTLTSFSTQKIDKTYEYRQMLAQKETLEKRRESYIALRERGGDVGELIQLEDKIIEVEAQLMEQAVDLGEYSDDNALCTINFTLHEGGAVSVASRLWRAFTWANGVYFGMLIGLFLACAAAYLLIRFYVFLRRLMTLGAETVLPAKPSRKKANSKADGQAPTPEV